jgi:hypothetical protein
MLPAFVALHVAAELPTVTEPDATKFPPEADMPVAHERGFVPSHAKTSPAAPAGQVVGLVAVFVASVTGGSICMLLPARAGTEAIPKGKINAANINNPLASIRLLRD